MSCDRYRNGIADTAAGGASAPGLEVHIGECEACRRELGAQRRALTLVDAELGRLLASTPSPDLSARIRRAVVADEGPVWWSRRGGAALAAAALLLLALGTVAVWRAASGVPGRASQTRLAPIPSAPRTGGNPPAMAFPSRSQTTRAPLGESVAGAQIPAEAAPALTEPSAPESPPMPSADPLEPEVLVPAGQEDALLRFAAELQSRSVTPDSILVADPFAPLSLPRPLHRVEIETLTIDSSLVSGL